MRSDEKPLTEKRVIDLAKAAQILIVATGTGLIIGFGIYLDIQREIQATRIDIRDIRSQTSEFQRNIRDRVMRLENRSDGIN